MQKPSKAKKPTKTEYPKKILLKPSLQSTLCLNIESGNSPKAINKASIDNKIIKNKIRFSKKDTFLTNIFL